MDDEVTHFDEAIKPVLLIGFDPSDIFVLGEGRIFGKGWPYQIDNTRSGDDPDIIVPVKEFEHEDDPHDKQVHSQSPKRDIKPDNASFSQENEGIEPRWQKDANSYPNDQIKKNDKNMSMKHIDDLVIREDIASKKCLFKSIHSLH